MVLFPHAVVEIVLRHLLNQLEAFEDSQKYKENKYIVERTKLVEEKWTGTEAG